MAQKKKKEPVVEEEEKEMGDEQVLLTDEFEIKTSVGNVIVRPWTYAELYKIADKLDAVFDIVENSDVDLSNFANLHALMLKEGMSDDEVGMAGQLYNSANAEFRRLLIKLIPHALPILSVSTGLEEEDLMKLNQFELITIGYWIYILNPAVLGNPLGLLVDGEKIGKSL